jgi:hypothetical protein
VLVRHAQREYFPVLRRAALCGPSAFRLASVTMVARDDLLFSSVTFVDRNRFVI